MERNKKLKLYIVISIICVALLFVIYAAYKVRRDHVKNLHLVVEKKIKEAAKDCFLKEECEGKITLGELYDKEYLEIQIDPVTKENMDTDLCIEYIDETIEFCEEAPEDD